MNKFKRMMIARGYWDEVPAGETAGGGSDGGWTPPESFGKDDVAVVERGMAEMDDFFGEEPKEDKELEEVAKEEVKPENEPPKEEVKPEEEDKRTPEEKAADEQRAHKGDGDINKIPKSWKSGLAEKYNQLDPDIKAEIHRREENFFNGFEQMRPAVEFGVAMDEAFRPFAGVLQEQQATPQSAVNYLLSVYSVLTKGTPEQRLLGIKHLMSEAKVSLESLTGQPDPEQAYVDPAVAELRNELTGVKSELQQRKAAEVEAARANAAKEYDAFVAKNPLATQLMEDMLPLLRAGHTLETAFEKAKWANPTVRAQLQKEQADLAKAEEEKRNKEKALRARQASRTAVRDNSRSGGPTAPLGDIDDTMKEVMSSINSRS